MKTVIFSAILILVATLMIAVFPSDEEARIYEDTLRLHILANSDSEDDQNLKLEVRDKLLEKYSTALSSAEEMDEAKESISLLLPDIERDAREWVRTAGYDYDVTASLGEEWYDTREYGEYALPAGRYTSLRIIIGEGGGRNWWCVMYPPLCTEIATERAPSDDALYGYSESEIGIITGGSYTVKFKILEMLSSAFSKNS